MSKRKCPICGQRGKECFCPEDCKDDADELNEDLLEETTHENLVLSKKVATLSLQLAASYAPCRECGEPPRWSEWLSGGPKVKMMCSRCGNDGNGELFKTDDEARAAWNLAMRGEG